MFASLPDLLRFVAVPIFAWAAYRDVRTRRVPNWVWVPPIVVGVVTLVLDGRSVLAVPIQYTQSFFLQVAVSLGLVAPLGYGVWRLGGFGGADAKAIMTLALLFPTYPVLYFSRTVLPLEQSTLGVFSLTILTNTVLIAMIIPLVLAGWNAINGRMTPAMFVGRPIPVETVPSVYGRLLQRDGTVEITAGGLDIDALRMYLRWRGATLDSMRLRPAVHRDPASIPRSPNDPGDGSLAHKLSDSDSAPERIASRVIDPRPDRAEIDARSCEFDDPWGASGFISDIDSDAYGTTPEQLRAGLELLCSNETESVWVTPGIPFLVVVFLGLLTALTYGDLLSTIVLSGLL